MKKRMLLLAILLTGGVSLGAAGLTMAGNSSEEAGMREQAVHLEQTEHELELAAGITEASTELMKEKNRAARSLHTEDGTEADVQMDTEADMAEEQATAETSVHETPQVASEFADIAIAQVNNYVNVRALPSTESEVLGKLYDKSAATVLEATEDGWYRITSGTVDGYVKAEYVVVGDEELARAVGTRLATVTTTTLFVRSEPTTEASVLTMLPEGDDLVALDESVEGWIKVETVEGEGYVSADYVNLSTEYIHAESKEEEEARLAKEEAERKAAAKAAEEARKKREEETKKQQSTANRPSSSNASNSAGNSASSASSSSSGNNSSASSSSSGSNSSASNSSSSGSNSSASSISNGQAVVNYGMQFLGNPYVYGGTSLTNGADCSGFVQSVYAAFGVSLPRNSAAQRSAGYAVSIDQIKPGDLVCYSGHIGIYAGNNTLLHASNERTGITLTSPITYRPVLAVRRIF